MVSASSGIFYPSEIGVTEIVVSELGVVIVKRGIVKRGIVKRDIVEYESGSRRNPTITFAQRGAARNTPRNAKRRRPPAPPLNLALTITRSRSSRRA
jgi:hypothetical protein